jgi:hypothetical protein
MASRTNVREARILSWGDVQDEKAGAHLNDWRSVIFAFTSSSFAMAATPFSNVLRMKKEGK